MGTKAVELADALKIERESYYRLERETYRLSLTQIEELAERIGIRPEQFWFSPPAPGHERDIDLNDLISGVDDATKELVVKAVKGMIGK